MFFEKHSQYPSYNLHKDLYSQMPKLILSAKSYSRSNYDTLSQYVEFVVNLPGTYNRHL